MDVLKMEEFRSNLLLLLQCGHPEGLPINQLKSEYKQYFNEDIAPEVILPRNYKNNKHWDTLFQLKELREDFALFFMGTAVYVKAVRRRNVAEMKLIAQLAKHSHLAKAKKGDFQCGCCPALSWITLSKEVANAANDPAPPPVVTNANANASNPTQNQTVIEMAPSQASHPHPVHPHPEDIVVKIEPHHMMTNGGESDDNSGSRGAHAHAGNDGLYSLVQQAAHGNPQNPQIQNNNYVNGGTIVSHDLSASGSSASSSNLSSRTNTNDGFMLDHQLRVQEHATNQNHQGQSLQAFASLLNSSGPGQTVGQDGSVSQQPFYTFVLQNGEIKVMQIVSSVSDGQVATNGDVTATVSTTPNLTITSPAPTARKSLPQKRNAQDATLEIINFPCSMPGCDEKFDIKQHLQNHERTCSVKKYPCTFVGCDRRFRNSKQRHAHMSSRHSSAASFHCTVPECAAFFKTADRLKVHESRCRFKYEQFQLMDVEEAVLNNNNSSFSSSSNQSSSVPNLNSSTESIEPQPGPNPNPAFASLQSASLPPEKVAVQGPSIHTVPGAVQIKLEGRENKNKPPGFSTVDLSLVKAETAE